MLAVEPLQLLIGACFATCVAANAGDDFSNNLFSDLAPLLALFGERVTTQFMSQSMGWADNIILAIIGRARENRAVADSELMSSTSNEVCELWNGQEIVRVMGEGPIRELVILLPKGISKNRELGSKTTTPSQPTTTSRVGSSLVDGQRTNPKISQDVLAMKLDKESNAKSDDESDAWKEHLEEYNPATIQEHIFGPQQRGDPSETEKCSGKREVQDEPTVQGNNSGDRVQQEQDPEKGLSRPHTQEVRDDSNSENPDESRLPIAVIRNTTAHTPNLTLNVHNQVGRGEHYVIAAFGIVLQLGVLVYCGFATYYPTLMFLKEGNPVAEYSFPCTAAGTLLLVAGMLACSYVVENSTSETRYRPVAGREARVIWLQRSGTVNDQAFKSFAIFPTNARTLVTTSQRLKGRGEKDSDQEDPRREDSDREDPGQEDPGEEDLGQEFVTVTATMVSICGFIVQFTGLRGMHWPASVAQLGATCPDDRSQSMDTHESREAVQGTENGVHPTPLSQPEEPNARSTAHRVMRIRRDLGELTDWHGPASAEAIAVARAIEVTMDSTLGTALKGTFSRSLSTLKSSEGSDRESIAFRVERGQNGSWKTYSDEIEAALSLWLYSVEKLENGQQFEDKREANGSEKQQTGKTGTLGTKPLRSKGDAWLRAKGTPAKPSLRLLGSHTAALQRDLQWWMPDGAAKVIELEAKSKSDSSIIEVESHRVVGFTPEVKSDPSTNIDISQYKRKSPEYPCEHAPCQAGPLAVESYIPLKTLYAQHMFSAFMWATTKTMDSPISDGADIQPTKPDGASSHPTWQSFTLHNARLSQMAENIKSTGLGTLEDVYLCIIPPLSTGKKLPRAHAIIEWARKHATPYEQQEHWKEATDAYWWLFRTAKTFPGQGDITTKATAISMEYRRAVTNAIKLREAQQFGKDIPELKRLKEKLEKELQDVGIDILAALMGLYETQSRSWECCLVKNPKPLKDEDMMLKFTPMHRMAHNGGSWEISKWTEANSAESNEKDILDWTPLHYAAAKPSPDALDKLLAYRADINARDIRGRTPLHYACRHNNAPTVVRVLIAKRADKEAKDRHSCTPLHIAASKGHEPILKYLIEQGAEKEARNTASWTPLYVAVSKGHEPVVKNLIKQGADKEAKDDNGGTPLHYAAQKGQEPVVKYLIEQGVNKEPKDNNERTPLYYAENGS
ncbi:hypothetical protein DL764_004400 [Monosporascus ibericus]|uniref:Uncharacterized protein n=1 Tax=Monosporascus ibericus TaxID=155417 RepID=A0A4Q4TDB8_9PEZI|nr:hypothetical protein DL764_004400 [Monosporascus ibericus]